MRFYVEDAVRLLIASDRPMSAREIAIALGGTGSSASSIRRILLRERPAGLVIIEKMVEAGHKAKRSCSFFTLQAIPGPRIPDLSRGWRNPATGLQPARLGLDTGAIP